VPSLFASDNYHETCRPEHFRAWQSVGMSFHRQHRDGKHELGRRKFPERRRWAPIFSLEGMRQVCTIWIALTFNRANEFGVSSKSRAAGMACM
jgi:hypothetical protein